MLCPADYFPLSAGRYEVRPGLSTLGRDFGNGPADGRVFQFDSTFELYRRTKLHNIERDRARFACEDASFNTQVRDAVTRWMFARLVHDWPAFFELAAGRLHCRLTQSSLELSDPDIWSQLLLQVQEDAAVLQINGEENRMVAIHLCLPNFWSAADKIGRDFAAVHVPVAGIGPINAKAHQHAQTMVNAVHGLVRFAWGITWDGRLDHHPLEEPANDRAAPAAAADPADAHLRVERQVIIGLPEVSAAIFTIRTYLSPLAEVKKNGVRAAALASALQSMSEESRRYKGVSGDGVDRLVAFLRA